MEEERKIETLQRMIDTHENIVFFGGAGVSTESGIRISGAWMVFTIRNTMFRRRRF